MALRAGRDQRGPRRSPRGRRVARLGQEGEDASRTRRREGDGAAEAGGGKAVTGSWPRQLPNPSASWGFFALERTRVRARFSRSRRFLGQIRLILSCYVHSSFTRRLRVPLPVSA